MALIDLEPTLLIAKHPELGSVLSALAALPFSALPSKSRRRCRRSRRALQCGVLLSSIAIAGWAAGGEEQARGGAAKTAKTVPHTEDSSGNPEFYEVFGTRYKVRSSSDGYHEHGIASWYGRPFHGRPTSSGEKYDMDEMTAAHTSLPLPTWVEVTNLSNGKSVVVKVNDRGPFVADRLIDLSYAAAKVLDIVRTGTARVEIRALGARPPEVLARAAPAPPEVAQDERLFAQASKFNERADAVELVDELKAQGLVNAFIVTEDGRRKSVHRVRVGPLNDAAEVELMSDRLRDLGARRSRSVVMP